MYLTALQTFIMILAIAFGAMFTRFTPFLLFPEHKEKPKYILYLGNVLPPAMLGLLVVYCLKDVSIFSGSHGIPEFLAILSIVLVHKWKNNLLLSIGLSTLIYMILIQCVFI